MARLDFRFRFPMRVRYAECDAQRVVFNSRYLEYLDVGVTEYWRAAGLFALPEPFESHVARTLIEYKAPLRNDEAFEVCLRTTRVGRSSMTQVWEIHGGSEGDDLRASGETVAVHVDLDTNRPLPVPDDIVRRFEAFEGRALRLEKAA